MECQLQALIKHAVETVTTKVKTIAGCTGLKVPAATTLLIIHDHCNDWNFHGYNEYKHFQSLLYIS